MSNGSKLDTSSFVLPDGEDVEVALIRLGDGRIVARTAAELELLERLEPTEEPPVPKP